MVEHPGGTRPWIFRTYAGHSTARQSNALFRRNLAKGQTGLSVAFDLPTQTGYDPDHRLSRGEVGKVGVPVAHIADMRALFDDIPLERMNTSMTINATAPWLLALYVAIADERGIDRAGLAGTTQNDIIKEFLSRGTYVFPPAPSMRLTCDVITWAYRDLPKWNPVNVCSYHLQEAGATPVQELAFALANAVAILDAVKESGELQEEDFRQAVGRISFFVNAGMKFVTELCKMRAFAELWDDITANRYGVTDPKARRFRYGVQVNSLGLTEQQPENNVHRILIEMLAVVLSKNARARAVQLPAWNEALGLPRPWDQQWSLRMQQIMAYETDILDYGDIFDGSTEIERSVAELIDQARGELARIEAMGGAVAAIDTGYMKQQLVQSNAKRVAAIEAGDQVVVGVNAFTDTEKSPLAAGDGVVQTIDAEVEDEAIAALHRHRSDRDQAAVGAAMAQLREALGNGANVMEPSIACAKAGVTTGEWGAALREVFGQYRAPTGVSRAPAGAADELAAARAKVNAAAARLGRPLKLLVGKPGLDGHSNGAEQIAVRARDCGMEVVYEGIRLTPEEIAGAALEESVHVVGLSILSGSHMALVADVIGHMEAAHLAPVPLVVGGIIPPEDARKLKAMGVAEVFTPKDYQLTDIICRIADLATADASR